MLKRFFPLLSAVCLSALLLAACSDDEKYEPTGPIIDPVEEAELHTGFCVINQGNQTDGVAGTLDLINPADLSYTDGIFWQVNQQSLGDTPQNGTVCGSKFYVAVYGSNLVWAIDRATKVVVAQIPTNAPEWVETDGHYVYVANNDGYVTRIDTTSFATEQIAVGPNPAGLAVQGDYLYCSISDGYNYLNNYANGRRVAQISLASFQVEQEIEVGLNPGRLCADLSGNVYVVCRGNYADVPSTVKRISPTGSVSELMEGSDMAIRANTLYVLNTVTDWNTGTASTAYTIYDTRLQSSVENHFTDADNAPYPTAIYVNPATGRVYLLSDPSPFGYAQRGYVYLHEPDGTFRQKFQAGIHPFAIVFS